jgi:hypothetical protein
MASSQNQIALRAPSRKDHQHGASSLPTFHLWEQLPNELKTEVPEHYLTFHNGVNHASHWSFIRMRLFPLLRVGNRKLAIIAKKAYYLGNKFRLEYYGSPTLLHIGQHIFKVELPIRCLSAGRLGSWSEDEAKVLQRNLPNLKDFGIVVRCRPDEYHPDKGWLKLDALPALITWLRPTVKLLGATRVHVHISSEGCPYDLRHEDLNCACAREYNSQLSKALRAL